MWRQTGVASAKYQLAMAAAWRHRQYRRQRAGNGAGGGSSGWRKRRRPSGWRRSASVMAKIAKKKKRIAWRKTRKQHRIGNMAA